MFPTLKVGKSVIPEKFIRTLRGKIYKIMTANNSKSNLGYFNKLVDQYNKTYHLSIAKKLINADYTPFTENKQCLDKNWRC